MADVTLKSGKVISVDVSTITVKEYREFIAANGSAESENLVIAKCTDMTPAEFESLLMVDSRQIIRAILKACNQPLTDPN